jgi:hypothetical protein
MTKNIYSMRVLLYALVLAVACTGWFYQFRKATKLEGRLMKAEHSLSQMDLRITSLALAILSTFDDEEGGGRNQRVRKVDH